MFLSIQYLRAMAALLVLLSHTAWKSMQIDNTALAWWHDAGTFGVDIFFIISGFIMTYTSLKMYKKPHAIQTFLKKRLIRIIPLYWFLTMIALCGFLLFPQIVNSSGGETAVLKSFFLLPLKANENYLVSVGWTLQFEFIFYFIFSLGLLFSVFRGSMLVVSLLILSFAVSIFFSEEITNPLVYAFVNNLFFEFALGMFLYYITQNGKKIHSFYLLFSIVLSLLWFYLTFSGYALSEIRAIDSGIPAFLLAFGLVSLEPFLKKRASSLLIRLGDSSYALYLSHPFSLVFVFMFYRKLENILPQNEFLLNLSMIIISLLIGYVVHIWIEKRLMLWIKSLILRRNKKNLSKLILN